MRVTCGILVIFSLLLGSSSHANLACIEATVKIAEEIEKQERNYIRGFFDLNMRFPEAEESIMLALTPLFFTGRVSYTDILIGPKREQVDHSFERMTRIHDEFAVPRVKRSELEELFTTDQSLRPRSIANVITFMAEKTGTRIEAARPHEIIEFFLRDPQLAGLRRRLREYNETIYETFMKNPELKELYRLYRQSIKYQFTEKLEDRPSVIYSSLEIQVIVRDTLAAHLVARYPELAALHAPGETVAQALIRIMAVDALPSE